ncbi:oxidoreductase, 2OG-Fe(II) oxygenase [Taibaiella sp. KBW10]|uniref:2OG-Fe(II) oxygenase n=1 Tax=Taibaiella sp. KBW10 TaxID=2153357 RepID=UPI000F59CD31|nr:2OG-Fe(II) oxygenase [Taibaiella sp. KBW10]RQO32274.1 oxidoreductase, 2OG-Fe(II) oxygenase [Taibaiella sp. KBW10]
MEKYPYSDDLFVIRHFLDEADCAALIRKAEMIGFKEAEVDFGNGVQRKFTGIRNNERIMYDDPGLAAKLWEKAKAFIPASINGGMARGFNEMFRFYKYSERQRFKQHRDGSFKRNERERSCLTFLIYLNEGFEGGATIFEDGTEIAPVTGQALVFLHPLKHQGSMVSSGCKYVLRTDVLYLFPNECEHI